MFIIYQNLILKLAKSIFLGHFDILTPVALFQSDFGT